jgi:glycosyltransferase involved in cell wall biosynthesis
MRIKHNVQSAQGMTRNYGLERARGEWIAFLDDDDFFLENKIETQLSRMKLNNFKFSSTNMYLINHVSVTLDKLDFFIMSTYFENGIPPVFNQKMICMTNYINNSSVIIHHSIVKQTGKLDLIPHGHEDWYYWKRALEYTDCMYINEPLVYYTKTINNNESVRYYN